MAVSSVGSSSASSSVLRRANKAFTDLYDEQRRTFLIQYPVWVILGLTLTGVVTFALTGFLGYNSTEPLTQPWLLFLWFCALLITLLISIFRDKSLRRQLIAMLVLMALAIAFVGVTYFSGSLPDFLRNLLQSRGFLLKVAKSPYTYTIVNFVLIGFFWVDTIHRWIRRSQGLAPNPGADIGLPDDTKPKKNDLPSLQELISGDLIAGAVLTFLLWFVFQPNIVASIIHPNGVNITEAIVSWPFGAHPPTISFIDLIQTLIYLPLGLLTLALTATVSGLDALQGVNENHSQDSLIMMKPENSTSTGAVTGDVTETLIDTIRSALDRRIRLLAQNLALAFRFIGVPVLLFVGTYGVAELSTNIEHYLHGPKILLNVAKYVLPGTVWGLGAVLGLVVSAALLLFRWRVFENTMRFLGLVGFIIVLTFWLFSLALWAINELILRINVSGRVPFTPPGWTTGISLVLLLLFGTLVLARRGRSSAGVQPASAALNQVDSTR